MTKKISSGYPCLSKLSLNRITHVGHTSYATAFKNPSECQKWEMNAQVCVHKYNGLAEK